jgi:NAD(P)-dependent dehydrogenase (short-subunit alcohol dehydrogenase family)
MLNARGASVAVLGRSREDLNGLSAEIGCETLHVDLGDPSAIHAAGAKLSTFDLLVNCAAVSEPLPFLGLTANSFERTMAVNAVGPILVSQYVARGMIARGKGGAIVNVSSVAAFVGIAGQASYCASKAALDAITRVMAIELGPHGIRVNSVNPVVTLTGMAAKAWSDPERAARRLARIPLGRFAEPQDVAEAIVYLLGDGARMMTGLSLPVDGGFTAV